MRTTLVAVTLAMLGTAGVAHAAGWQGPISDETAGTWCGPSNEGVNGFDCQGSYCDNVWIRCEPMPFGMSMASYSWSDFYSEEDSGFGQSASHGWYGSDLSYSEVCHWRGAPSIMTGIRCNGGHCDNISIECGRPTMNVGGTAESIELDNCFWTGPRSEEQPPLHLGVREFISGITCYGSNCDDKTFYVCEAAAPGNSCVDRCGGQAPDACWCDGLCSTYGDCCDDYAGAC
ncbi:MAG: hypothetical protein ACE37F_32145 [Nannocystaceae bacterium]|nr:hypothetical protein [bacterium]